VARTVVVGGGLVGLATAWALVRTGRDVVVLEKEDGWARHQSGHSSGVVHSGLYYAPGSLKARLTPRAVERLASFCAEHDVPYRTTGKLVVAGDERELPRLAELARRGEANGVRVQRLSPAQAREHEPHVRSVAALHVASTGVCDYPALAGRLADLLHDAGAELRLGSRVLGLRPHADGAQLLVDDSDGRWVLDADAVAVCAGLHADRLAGAAARDDDPAEDLRVLPFRGEYRALAPAAEHLVRGLVYPVPDPDLPFLGVHLTRGVDGHVHVGPNAVPALAREGYRRGEVSPADLAATLRFAGSWRLARRHWRHGAGEVARAASDALFVRAVRRLLPDLRADDLTASPAGVRAQAVRRDGRLHDDFALRRSGPVVHVLNAPSPAATASLLIGEHVAAALVR
jgi:L-2-hydroxyglutarate oxidase